MWQNEVDDPARMGTLPWRTRQMGEASVTTRKRAAILMTVDAASWFLAVIAAVFLRYDLSLTGVTPRSIVGTKPW